MRKIASLILFLCFASHIYAQKATEFYIIKLKDKGINKYDLANPKKYLSDRSLERRILQQIPLDETDMPVNQQYLNELSQLGVNIFYTSKWLNTVIGNVTDESAIKAINSLPFVQSVETSKKIEAKRNFLSFKRFFETEKVYKIDTKGFKLSTQNLDYGYGTNQAHMIKIHKLHELGFTGEGVIIAVIDAGFNSVNNMPIFDSLFASNKILGTRDFVQPGNNVYNTNLSTHGTMVLSTMGANIPGLLIGTAPHASYYLFRSEDATAEYLLEEYYWVQAAEYADSLGVDIINTSLGYTRFDNPAENHTYEDMNGNTTVITIAADMAAKKGMLVVVSAGNEGGSSWRFISAPADGDSVMAVGAVDASGSYAYFSSTGPTPDGRVKPDIVTQGSGSAVSVIPTGVAYGNGTSFAAPILSGAAACLWQANSTHTNMEIFNAIKRSGSKANNPDNLLGWGIPDFLIAYNILINNVNDTNYNSDKINAYPNPFADYINVEFNLDSSIQNEIRIVNSLGKTVKSLKTPFLPGGTQKIRIDNLDALTSGVYFIQVSNSNTTIIRKVLKK